MLRMTVLALAAAAALAFAQQPAQARDYPWCLISGYGGQHCAYDSLEACLRDKVGGGGFCNPSSSYRAPAQPRPKSQRTRRR
jgi:Protein of unknown function (DUF3551)